MTRTPTANLLMRAADLEPGQGIMVDGIEVTVLGWEAFGPPGHEDWQTLAIRTDGPFTTIIRDRDAMVSALLYDEA